MDLPELGVLIHEHSNLRIVNWTIRALGFTAVAIEALLDEINDEEWAADRWGMEEAV